MNASWILCARRGPKNNEDSCRCFSTGTNKCHPVPSAARNGACCHAGPTARSQLVSAGPAGQRSQSVRDSHGVKALLAPAPPASSAWRARAAVGLTASSELRAGFVWSVLRERTRSASSQDSRTAMRIKVSSEMLSMQDRKFEVNSRFDLQCRPAGSS